MTWTVGSEREVLEQQVDNQREAIARLLDRVDDAEARERLVPSLTTVLGLVTHATFVEQVWLHGCVGGARRSDLGIPRTVEESFVLADDDTVDSVRARYLAACERSRAIAAEHDLDEEFSTRHGAVSLRWVLAHLIQELARHAGHGDILVEQLVARRSA